MELIFAASSDAVAEEVVAPLANMVLDASELGSSNKPLCSECLVLFLNLLNTAGVAGLPNANILELPPKSKPPDNSI